MGGVGIPEDISDPAGKGKVTTVGLNNPWREKDMPDKKSTEVAVEIELEVEAIEVTTDAPKSFFIKRPTTVGRMRLLNKQWRNFKTALMKLKREEKKEFFAYDFAVAVEVFLGRLVQEDGENEVLALSILADLLVKNQTHFDEKYAPFKAAGRFVKALAESDKEVDIRHYLVA